MSDKNGDRILRKWGIRAGYAIAIITVATVVYAATDKTWITPKIERTSCGVFHSEHDPLEARDTARIARIEKRQDAADNRDDIRFKVLYQMNRAMMTEKQRQRARDVLINDTTIPREMIYP